MILKVLFLFSIGIFAALPLSAQTVEVYRGNDRAGIDLLWFSLFKNPEGKATPWLFFSRNRASVNQDDVAAFGSTQAVSYNLKNGTGFVGVGFFGAGGFVPKAGVQFVKMTKEITFFGWSVVELETPRNADVFGLLRYEPRISGQWRGFFQAESFNVFALDNSRPHSFTQRFRVGTGFQKFQFGLMSDFNQFSSGNTPNTRNSGLFLRHVF